MKAVLLCAGKGTRLLPLTSTTPKPLLIANLKEHKTILECIIESLPKEITDIYIVGGHLYEVLENYIKNLKSEKNITLVKQDLEIKGTHGAVLAIKPFLKENELFYIQNGDDIFLKSDIERMLCLKKLSFGVGRQVLPENYWSIESNDDHFDGFRSQTRQELANGALAGSGAYVLDSSYFELPVSKTINGEASIPHTLRDAKEYYKTKIHEHESWVTANDHSELEKMQKYYESDY